MKDKKTICLSCGTPYYHKENDGLCPVCSAYNSADNTPEVFQGATSGVTPVKVVFDNPTSIPSVPAAPPPAYVRAAAKKEASAYAAAAAKKEAPAYAAAATKKEIPAWLPISFFVIAAIILVLTVTVSLFKSISFQQKNKSENVEVVTLSGTQDPQAQEYYMDILGFKTEELLEQYSNMEGYVPVTVELVTYRDEYNNQISASDFSLYLKCGDSYTTDEVTGAVRMVVKGLDEESASYMFFSEKPSIKVLFFIPEKQFDSYTLCVAQTEYERYKYQEIATKIIEIPLEAPVQGDK